MKSLLTDPKFGDRQICGKYYADDDYSRLHEWAELGPKFLRDAPDRERSKGRAMLPGRLSAISRASAVDVSREASAEINKSALIPEVPNLNAATLEGSRPFHLSPRRLLGAVAVLVIFDEQKGKRMSTRAEKIAALQLKSNRIRCQAENLLNEERDEVQRPKLRKLVGKCFKYLNSYGGPDAKWWLYSRVVSLDEKKMTFMCVQFQHTSRQHVEIRHRLEFNLGSESPFGVESGWKPISAKEYARAKKEILKTVDGLFSL